MSLDDIIKFSSVKVENPIKTVKLCRDDLPNITEINNFEEFKKTCEILNLPTIDEEMLDPNYYCRNMLVYLMNISSEIPLDLEEIVENNVKIEQYFEFDRKIDDLEIRLAELKSDYELLNIQQVDILNEIENLEKIKGLDENKIISILRSNEEVQRFLKKEDIMCEIYSYESTLIRDIFIKIIENEFINVKDLENMGIDRINVLKLVYQLCIKGIIVYDQQKDLIRMNK